MLLLSRTIIFLLVALVFGLPMKGEDDPEDKPGSNSGEKPGNSSEDQSMNNTEIKPEKPFKFGKHANVKNWKCSSLKKDYCEKLGHPYNKDKSQWCNAKWDKILKEMPCKAELLRFADRDVHDTYGVLNTIICAVACPK